MPAVGPVTFGCLADRIDRWKRCVPTFRGRFRTIKMSYDTDIKVKAVQLYFIPVETRVPLKFGSETLTRVTCARAFVTVEDRSGRRATGWGETPLSVQWVWPSALAYSTRHDTLAEFTRLLAGDWVNASSQGHPLEIGFDFQETNLKSRLAAFNADGAPENHPVPWLAALVCSSLFDLAVHDAFGNLCELPVYDTYRAEFMNRDLSAFLEEAAGCRRGFRNRYPVDLLVSRPPTRLKAWHLVGGLDPLTREELTGNEPTDGYPVVLTDWIVRDGLKCLKIKLRGNDADWDYDRLVRTGRIGVEHGVEWLTADFNCTVDDPDYVTDVLDRLRDEHPRLFGMLLYVEQPFPYELEENRIPVHAVSARKPLFLDESAHDWRMIRLGRELGWTGVALKTCKTQSGAVLSACWARAHGMTLMVQDLTNPMLAQIPHLQLAAHVGTIMGVETNSMQFYPEASAAEAAIHPGLYRRLNGLVDLSTIDGAGFGYRLDEIHRSLPEPAVVV